MGLGFWRWLAFFWYMEEEMVYTNRGWFDTTFLGLNCDCDCDCDLMGTGIPD